MIAYKIRDFTRKWNGAQQDGDDDNADDNTHPHTIKLPKVVYQSQSSYAFSILCIFFTVMYSAFRYINILQFICPPLKKALLMHKMKNLSSHPSSHNFDVSRGIIYDNRQITNSAPGYIGGSLFMVLLVMTYMERGKD